MAALSGVLLAAAPGPVDLTVLLRIIRWAAVSAALAAIAAVFVARRNRSRAWR